jgi:hypothetical protein
MEQVKVHEFDGDVKCKGMECAISQISLCFIKNVLIRKDHEIHFHLLCAVTMWLRVITCVLVACPPDKC